MRGISLYPTLKGSDIERMGYQFVIESISYIKDFSKINIDYDYQNNNIILSDKTGSWNIKDHGFNINISIKIKKCDFLFGPNGIASSGSSIGFGLRWFSKESQQMGTIKLFSISSKQENLEFKDELEFGKGMLRGELILRPFLYLEKRSNKVVDMESHLVNKVGYHLGNFDDLKIIIDGDGSLFPFKDVEKPGAPLWWVTCAWDDPNYDKFSKTVTINLNTVHPQYEYLDINNPKYNESFVNEIMYNAIEIIINKFEKDEQQGYSFVDSDSGSVSEAINYWRNTFDIDGVNPEDLAYKIRESINLEGRD